MSELPYEGPPSFLISRLLLDESGLEWRSVLQTFKTHCLQYPDGSYEVFYDRLSPAQVDCFNNLYRLLLDTAQRNRANMGRKTGAEGFQTNFRGLWGNPRRLYTLWYPDSVQAGLQDMSLLVLPDPWSQQTSNELSRDHLSIAIALCRKPDESARRRVADTLAKWFFSVSRCGVHGEGPVKPVNALLEWRGRGVFFEADFSQSGQATLNWLTLYLINHCASVPIELISYGNPDAQLLRPLQTGKRTVTKLKSQDEALDVSASTAIREPGGARVRRGAGFQPDRATIQIALAEPVDVQKGTEVESVVNAWLLLGIHGGYRGHFAYHSTLIWSPEADSLRFQVDMGDSDVDIALTVLERVLNNVDNEIARVQHVVVTSVGH